MVYIVRSWTDERESGVFTAEKTDRFAALETALELRAQGIPNIVIRDPAGQEFSLVEFEKFCAGKSD